MRVLRKLRAFVTTAAVSAIFDEWAEPPDDLQDSDNKEGLA
jgi:hypothetical protein